MEKYKSKLRTQNVVFLFGIVLLIAVQVLAYCRVIQPVAASERWADGCYHFCEGRLRYEGDGTL